HFVRHTWLQTKIDQKSKAWVLRDLQGQVNIGAIPGVMRRNDSYDLIILVIEFNRPSNDTRVAKKMLAPEFIRQHGHGLRVLAVNRVGRKNSAAEKERHFQIAEAIADQADHVDVFGKLTAGQSHRAIIHNEEAVDDR